MSSAHTPTPWQVGGSTGRIIYAQDGFAIADAKVFHGRHEGSEEANAAFIVRACNAHDDLMKALQLTLSGLENGNVKSKPLIDFGDENAENLPMMSLEQVIRAAIAKGGAA